MTEWRLSTTAAARASFDFPQGERTCFPSLKHGGRGLVRWAAGENATETALDFHQDGVAEIPALRGNDG